MKFESLRCVLSFQESTRNTFHHSDLTETLLHKDAGVYSTKMDDRLALYAAEEHYTIAYTTMLDQASDEVQDILSAVVTG